MHFSRRLVLAGGAAALAFSGMVARAQPRSGEYRNEIPGYGPLIDDPEGLLDLPDGFSYRVISQAGETMDDGLLVPGKADGMGCFPGEDGQVILVRNHEVRPRHLDLGPTGVGHRLRDQLPAEKVFDTYADGHPLGGGTTTLIYDLAQQRVVRQHLSLTGTLTNCAGGVTPWRTWLSCEENEDNAGSGVNRNHGWVFEVPADATGLVDPVPLTAMGRFEHEAACVDPETSHVYLTEDRDDSLFYRFIPTTPGRLADGGRLQALVIAGAPAADTRNWNGAVLWRMQDWLDVEWVDLDEVESPNNDLRQRGHAAGAALFARGEGLTWGDGELFFTCTSGGVQGFGQIMRMVPGRDGTPDRIQLFLESDDEAVFDYGDNLTVAPWGHLLVCEDRYSAERIHIRAIAPDGQVYTIARNAHPDNGEFAGVCVSPDGSTVFVNVLNPGYTLAITGPWRSWQSS
ncbi:MAG: DUF839 domain-containing protein [Caulobacterales bacterium]|nr:DUF839 domain-containing protein [Caulobacterales bacterium]